MQKQKDLVLITGGSGYIGTAIIDKLHHNYDVINLDLSPPKKHIPEVEYLKLDLSSSREIKSVLGNIRKLKGKALRSIIHLAGYYNFNGKDDSQYMDVNVSGTKVFLHELKKLFDIKQFIFASTMLAYAPSKIGVKIKENDPLDQSWAYPASKIAAEEIIKESLGTTKGLVLRIAAVYNEFGYAPSIAHQVLRISETQLTSFLFPGNKNHIQSTIHVDDVAEAIKLAVMKERELPNFTTLSLAEDNTPTYDQLQKRISSLIFKRELPYFRIPKMIAKLGANFLAGIPLTRESFIRPWMIKYADANYELDNSAAKNLLKWQPEHNINSTLPKIINNLISNKEKWYRINKTQLPPAISNFRMKVFKNALSI